MEQIKWIYDIFEDLTSEPACNCSVILDGQRWNTDIYIEVAPQD